MQQKYPPINPRFPHFLHGADYNPDQWRATPEIWDEDIRLSKSANCNSFSIGIFSWSALEPHEGKFDFDWLDTIFDKIAQNKAYVVLATPSGARPPWMSAAYPEVLRVGADRRRILHGLRHNHCYTSPVYRAKVAIINTMLAQRYKDHPALLVWHISNEYSGECHCLLCQKKFIEWLMAKYENNLDHLNMAWSCDFWGSRFTEWSQIESPSPIGETVRHGLNLDWKRFVTHQSIDFFKAERAPLKAITPSVPVTTNFAGIGLNFDMWKMAEQVDVVSWDSYPLYNDRAEMWKAGAETSFSHDLMRSFKHGKPFMLMESSPSATNWWTVCKLKRPGILKLEALQAVAHGADTVQYFQWRKCQGGAEKFHGAVVDHCGHENTRVFKEVAKVGEMLSKLDSIIGSTSPAEVAIVYDWENRWIVEDIHGARNDKKEYLQRVLEYYLPLWSQGVPVDCIRPTDDMSKYKIVVAPLLYMIHPGVAEHIETFVAKGGTFICTYLSGIADPNDRCFLGGFPGPLRKVLGIWAEELDALYDDESVPVAACQNGASGLSGSYQATLLCDLIHAEGAEVLAHYDGQFYAGKPAVTRNSFGKGSAYYVASHNDERFYNDFIKGVVLSTCPRKAFQVDLPQGVTVQTRTSGSQEFIFILNFTHKPHILNLSDACLIDVETGISVSKEITLKEYDARVFCFSS